MHWSDSSVEVCALGTYNTPWINLYVRVMHLQVLFLIFCVKILDEERHGSFLTNGLHGQP